jgi:hypothetical protein
VWIFDQVQKARKEAAVRLEAADVRMNLRRNPQV